jgi:3-hydroxybutyryl-CoA dehydrogenase
MATIYHKPGNFMGMHFFNPVPVIKPVDLIRGLAKLGNCIPIGPLAVADLIGLDTLLMIMESLYDDFSDSKYRPCPLLRKMVRAGCLGRKTGRGFYHYP